MGAVVAGSRHRVDLLHRQFVQMIRLVEGLVQVVYRRPVQWEALMPVAELPQMFFRDDTAEYASGRCID